jgi:hypothetical protein
VVAAERGIEVDSAGAGVTGSQRCFIGKQRY